MNQRFENRVALITGGASGIGKGIAHRIAFEGGKIVLADINQNLLQQTVDEFKNEGFDVSGVVTDVSDESSVRQCVQHAIDTYGKLDITVNSAGIVGSTNRKIADYSTEEFDKIYAVNLRGSFLITKYSVKEMQKNNYGRVLLIASIAGKEGNPNMMGYSATKAGVIGIVKAAGKEFAETGITVNGIAPAVIQTPFNDNTAPEQLTYMTAKIPMKRLGTIEEVAALVAWIVSEEASFNTGFIFDISGGRATY